MKSKIAAKMARYRTSSQLQYFYPSVFSVFFFVFFFFRKGSSCFNLEWVHKSFSYIATMLWNSLLAKIREVQGIDDFKKPWETICFNIFSCMIYDLLYDYHNYCNLFTYNSHIFRVSFRSSITIIVLLFLNSNSFKYTFKRVSVSSLLLRG